MKVSRFIGPNKVEIREETIPKASSSELLIRVKRAGICGTDLHIFNGSNKDLVKPGTVLGHEFTGIVEEIGDDVLGWNIGDRVAVEPNLYCGECYYCRSTKKHFCQNWSAIGLTRDGGFQEYCAIPSSAAYRLPSSIDYVKGAFFEPLACVIHGVERSKLKFGETVVVQGAGGIGQLFIKVLATMGMSDIIVSDINDRKLELAKANGATHTVNVTEQKLEDTVGSVTDDIGAQVMIDAAGLVSTIPTAVSLLEKTGRVLIFGVPNEQLKVEVVPYDIYKKEIEIIGSYTNPYSNQKAIDLLQRIEIDDLVTDIISLQDIVPKGFEKIGDENVLKVQIRFDS